METPDQIAARVQCDKSGSCVVFATELCKCESEGVRIVEGTVRFEGSVPFPHVWTEIHGVLVDPTLEQFNYFELDTVEYLPRRGYSSHDFLVAIQNHSQWSRFDTLKKL